jgi:prolyl-tRNA editing enzyme YbaK/EbsC (Cys-tRNA(Pro) deacylase)
MGHASPETEPRAVQRVREALTRKALAAEIRLMPDSTRTAEDAAAACGCGVAQIVKSRVFRGQPSGTPILILVSGVNRVDTARIRSAIGEELVRPDAAFVRDVTGFAIGGIPPLGHDRPLRTLIDRDLLEFPFVWAAAGTPNAVMRLDPRALAEATGGAILTVA